MLFGGEEQEEKRFPLQVLELTVGRLYSKLASRCGRRVKLGDEIRCLSTSRDPTVETAQIPVATRAATLRGVVYVHLKDRAERQELRRAAEIRRKRSEGVRRADQKRCEAAFRRKPKCPPGPAP